ncbi:hypothetical protein [Flavobacterium sp.]|jgi:hypothetical protein|uniref:hypothetical protein n=1 Tax=Flavobacterium sp. TaxID=239 RepID=UPI0037BF3E2E
MKIVNSLIILFIVMLLSCNKKNNSNSNQSNLKTTSSYVDFDADSVYYKLSVGFENDDYLEDEKSNLLFLVTREVYVEDKNFGGYNQDWSKAEDYSKKNNKSAYLVTKISIKKKNNTYETVWKFDNQIDFYNDSYGLYGINVSLNDSYNEYNNKLQSRLHINFKTEDEKNGYKLYTLSYINQNKQWQLVSRERICTIRNDINDTQFGYCIDTINNNCVKKADKFTFSVNDFGYMDHMDCN